MNETGALNVILNILILVSVGAVGMLVRRVLKDVDALKALYARIDRMEVKVESLWSERTDSGYNTNRR